MAMDTSPAATALAAPADMAPLIERLEQLLAAAESPLDEYRVTADDWEVFKRASGFAPRGKGRPEVVLAADVAVELGHPSTPSVTCVLLTSQPGTVQGDRIRRLGPDLQELSTDGPQPFGQIVLVQKAPEGEPDPFDLDNLQYLSNRLPGYMIRSVPGRLWVRISRRARSSGLSLRTVGQALIAAYTSDVAGVEQAEVVFLTADAAQVEALEPLVNEAKILAGQHKKLVLCPDGEVECEDLNCDECDEQAVCDALRDVIIKRRRKR